MEKTSRAAENFEPELYCLRCQRMDWDEDARRCINFDTPRCPLDIRNLLAGIEVTCLVI